MSVPDELAAYYSARVALLEQWAADAEPMMVMIHNFSGQPSWAKYVHGVKELLAEAGLESLPISGSTETNMTLLQSAISVTMIGKRNSRENHFSGRWFTYGSPLVGEELLREREEIALIGKLQEAFASGLISHIWPIGSKGIQSEMQQLFAREQLVVKSLLNIKKSAGPSTVVLIEIPENRIEEARSFFGKILRDIEVS